MVQSDALSRQPDHIPDEDTDNKDLVLLPDKLFINLVNIELAKMIESAATEVFTLPLVFSQTDHGI